MGRRPTQRLDYEPGATIFAQGEAATSVMYLEGGNVQLSVLSHTGKEAVIAVLQARALLWRRVPCGPAATDVHGVRDGPCTILAIEKSEMVRHLHAQPAFADRFLTHMLTRNIRIEEDLVDHLFNSSEKRLARTLLLLARYGEPEVSHRSLPRVSQETLAEMVGTTRSRVNFFMNKFRKLGFIEYNGGLRINNSLLMSSCATDRTDASSSPLRRMRCAVLGEPLFAHPASVFRSRTRAQLTSVMAARMTRNPIVRSMDVVRAIRLPV